MNCSDNKKVILYDKDNIQLVKRKDKATGEDTYSIITPETYVVLTEKVFNAFVKIYIDSYRCLNEYGRWFW